jgi:hypothetical protein
MDDAKEKGWTARATFIANKRACTHHCIITPPGAVETRARGKLIKAQSKVEPSALYALAMKVHFPFASEVHILQCSQLL